MNTCWIKDDVLVRHKLINKNTGEIDSKHSIKEYKDIEAYVNKLISNRIQDYQESYQKAKQRNKKFQYYYKHRHYMQWNNNSLDELASCLKSIPQLEVASCLINHVNKNTNKVKMSYKKINEFTNVVHNTISKTLKALKSSPAFKVNHNSIFVSPMFMVKTNKLGCRAIWNDYFYSSKPWWKDINGNDEYTIKGKNYKLHHSKSK